MRRRIVSRACRVCCFCCSGDPVRGHRRCPAAGEEGGKGTTSASGRPYCTREALQFAQLLCGGLLTLKAQSHPLQQVNQRIQCRILVIGRTLAWGQPRLRLTGHMLLQHLHQARFPMPASPLSNTTCPRPSFTCAQRSRSSPLPAPGPRVGQAGAASHVQATARCTLGQHLIDLQRLGEAL